MTLNTIKRLLNLATGLMLVAASGILVWGFSSTRANNSFESQNPAETGIGKVRLKRAESSIMTSTTNRASRTSETSDLAALVDRPLRRPLFDPPPPPPKVVEKKVLPPIRARLVATMIEPENSIAVLRLASGGVVFRKVGEPLGTEEPNAKIARIEAGAVCVSREGDETRLVVDGQKSR
jgi:hypothetical protein